MKEPAHDDERLSARDGHSEGHQRETPVVDDERLSTLLEGRLTDRQREELLAHLDAHSGEYDVLAEAAAILMSMEEEDAPPPGEGLLQPEPAMAGTEPGAPEAPPPEVAPLRAYAVRPRKQAWRGDPADSVESDAAESAAGEGSASPPDRPYPLPPRRGGWRRRAGAAGAVLMLVLATVLLVRGRSPGADPMVLAAALDRGNQRLPEGWEKERGWGVQRGAAEAKAVQAGALLVDLSVAAHTNDTTRTREIATQLLSRYLPGEAATGPLHQLAARAGAPPEELRPLLAQATERIEARLGRDPVRAGAWVEAALLAADARDEEFFQADATGRPPRALERLAKGDAGASGALAKVRAALPRDGAPDWKMLASELKSLMTTIDGSPEK
ncbi:MAG TPA: hypothetical protein VF665_21510 [Longimicrobium sp.]|uniref:hypothetical protein n=1 Tax=Longimicrobium sp. TaxID=2029185 RepID=UPI002ED8D6F4